MITWSVHLDIFFWATGKSSLFSRFIQTLSVLLQSIEQDPPFRGS